MPPLNKKVKSGRVKEGGRTHTRTHTHYFPIAVMIVLACGQIQREVGVLCISNERIIALRIMRQMLGVCV